MKNMFFYYFAVGISIRSRCLAQTLPVFSPNASGV